MGTDKRYIYNFKRLHECITVVGVANFSVVFLQKLHMITYFNYHFVIFLVKKGAIFMKL